MLRVFPHYQSTLSGLWRIGKPGIRLDLEPMKKLTARLGEPWKDFTSILISGTNGKGSTACMLSEILFRSGYKVGLYTSPHLCSYKERIVVRNPAKPSCFNEEIWCSCFAKVSQAIEDLGLSLTQFEILTALCFSIFQAEGVDVAVLEVGLGGRLDATNVVEPALSLVTLVDHDHHEFLGNTLQSISREKAGIFREGVPCMTLKQSSQVLEALADEALRVGTKLTVVKPGTLRSISPYSQSFFYENQLYESCLVGWHQVENASLVIEAARMLQKLGISIPEDKIREGIRKAFWPVRFESLEGNPLIILDGAHNPHGALALAGSLNLLHLEPPHVFVVGILETKDVDGILHSLSSWGDEWIFCRSWHPRALPASKLLMAAQSISSGKNAQAQSRVGDALRLAFSQLKGKGTICVTGSLSVAGEARRILKGRKIS